MNISGIRPYEGFYSYNSIKINELRNQQIAASQANKVEPEDKAAQTEELPVEQNFTAMDYDLDKDKVLMQYQYFVGEKPNVVPKENTSLGAAEKALRSGENFFL